MSRTCHLEKVSLAERALALWLTIEKMPASPQQRAISVQASQLAMMLETQGMTLDRYRLRLSLEFDEGDACVITAEGSRQDMERLKARIGYWNRLEHKHASLDQRTRLGDSASSTASPVSPASGVP